MRFENEQIGKPSEAICKNATQVADNRIVFDSDNGTPVVTIAKLPFKKRRLQQRMPKSVGFFIKKP
jgi:hypothetical protein